MAPGRSNSRVEPLRQARWRAFPVPVGRDVGAHTRLLPARLRPCSAPRNRKEAAVTPPRRACAEPSDWTHGPQKGQRQNVPGRFLLVQHVLGHTRRVCVQKVLLTDQVPEAGPGRTAVRQPCSGAPVGRTVLRPAGPADHGTGTPRAPEGAREPERQPCPPRLLPVI